MIALGSSDAEKGVEIVLGNGGGGGGGLLENH